METKEAYLSLQVSCTPRLETRRDGDDNNGDDESNVMRMMMFIFSGTSRHCSEHVGILMHLIRTITL